MSEHKPPQIASVPSLTQYPITALLIALNVLYFGYAAWHGLDLMNPNAQAALVWGADFPPLSFFAEPYRLFSSLFFHFGLLHLAFNMWALYAFGSVAEPLWGRSWLLVIYFSSGLMGNLVSGGHAMWITLQDGQFPAVSGGASGAIMGLAGALTLWSCLPVFAQQRFILNRKALLTILGINLILGMSIAGINQTAHLGGLIMGVLMALLGYGCMRMQRYALPWLIIMSIGLCGLVYWGDLILLNRVAPIWQSYFSH